MIKLLMNEKCLYSYSQSVIFIKKNPLIIFWLSLLCSFISICSNQNNNQLFAQANIKFEHLTVDQGLSQNFITSIFQDSEGYLWIGTHDGLNKYDGYRFTNYYYDLLDSSSLSNSSITTIFEDRIGKLWIGTFGELNCFDKGKNAFRRYPIENVNWICEDKFGNLWIATNESGLYHLDRDRKNMIHYEHDPAKSTSLPDNQINTLQIDRTDTLWIGTTNGYLCKFDSSSNSFPYYLLSPEHKIDSRITCITSILEDKNGLLWIGTTKGLFKFDQERRKFTQHDHDPKNPNSLSINHILCLTEDVDGYLWIGTDKGSLNKFDRDKNIFYRYQHDPTDPTSLSHNTVMAIFQDRSHTFWVGTYAAGLEKFNPDKMKFDHFRHDKNDSNSLCDNVVWSVYEDKDKILWVGTNRGLNKIDRVKNKFTRYCHHPNDPHSLGPYPVRAIVAGEAGELWLGTLGGGIYQFNKKSEQFTRYHYDKNNPQSLGSDLVYTLLRDDAGNLWIGANGTMLEKFDPKKQLFKKFTYQNVVPDQNNYWITSIHQPLYRQENIHWLTTWADGVLKFDQLKEEFTYYRHVPGNPYSLKSNTNFAIFEDKTGTVWIGSNGYGLIKLEPEQNEITYYTTRDGLPENTIVNIVEDNDGYLWLSTNQGISRFDPRTISFKNYDVTDGLQSNAFNLGACFKSSSGELFLGGPNGLNCFYPNNLVNLCPPEIALANFKMYGKTINFDKPLSQVEEISLSYRENFFTFEFVALHFEDSRRNQYAYKLESFDKDWIDSGYRREAIYTNVPPGKYIFRVKAANSDGIWNEQGISIKLRVTPPYWQTWWFCLICFSLLCVIIGSIIKFRISQALKIEQARNAEREQIQKKMRQDFHDELGNRASKISLISNLLRSKLQSPAPMINEFISNIIDNADSLSAEMREHIWEIDPEKDTLYHLANHLKNFSDKLFELTDIGFQLQGLSPAIEQKKMPLEWRQHLIRIFKEGMNNILKHAEGCKNVTLEFKLENRQLEIIISDDGKGFDHNTITLGNGLKNMQERAQQINGSLSIISYINEGTKILFKGKLP